MGSALVQHQLSYPAAIAHKNVCTQLGLTSQSASMCVIYDEVARYLMTLVPFDLRASLPLHRLAGSLGLSAWQLESWASMST
jgi:uncharacterized linocin/CFP29 family protein